MKNRLLSAIFLIICFAPNLVKAQGNGQWQIRVLGGIFAPSNDEIQNIYGDGLTGTLALVTPLGDQGRLKFGVNSFNRSGDPFYQSTDFDAGDAGELTLRGLSAGLETFMPKSGFPRIYFGAGLDYIFGKEAITGQEASTGRALGVHLSVSPEIRVSDAVSLFAEAQYRFLEMTFKSGRDRYKFNLSGASLLVGLGFNL